ncbi:hypothetical protein AB8B21_03075 [Tardiphaga sp. 866_E4_N2_1]|uniref:hypothetical protein n=1 Tax=unclassified Tardiphaga TaxID=2631404 RepID=UPI003F2799BB
MPDDKSTSPGGKIANVLIVVTSVAQVRDTHLLVDLLSAQPGLRPVVFSQIGTFYGGLDAFCEARNIDLFDPDGKTVAGTSFTDALAVQGGGDALRTYRERAFFWLHKWWFAGDLVAEQDRIWQGILEEVERLAALREIAHRILQTVDPSVIVLAEDNVAAYTARWTKMGGVRGAKSVIIPYTLATAREALESISAVPEYVLEYGRLSRFIRRWLRMCVHPYGALELTRLPKMTMVAAEIVGFSEATPWIYNSGSADVIVADSHAMARYYADAGRSRRGKIKTLGGLRDDTMAQLIFQSASERSARIAELGLDPSKRTVLCALPPDQGCRSRPGCEFDDFSTLVKFWLETITENSEWNVIVNPHPALQERVLDELSHFNAKVLQNDVSTLIPLCDLYVTSISATTRWAIANGCPVLNYDVYQYHYADFDGLPAVLTVRGAAEFAQSYRRLTTDERYLEVLTSQQADIASDWGMLDGGSSARIGSLILSLANGNRY